MLSARLTKQLARELTLVENELEGYQDLLRRPMLPVPLVGITGPPGAGKSSLVNSLLSFLTHQKKQVAVLAVDPSSPFHLGALLGDRVRMAQHFTSGSIFIRSVANRGNLGGLSSRAMEMCDLIRQYPFDLILVETVGVGQSEIEVAGIADVTVLVLVPESGDDIQQIKSGIMEVGDLFVVNKSDRPAADLFTRRLSMTLHARAEQPPYDQVVSTVATEGVGIDVLWSRILLALKQPSSTRRIDLLTEKAWQLICKEHMRKINYQELKNDLKEASGSGDFHLYRWVRKYYPST